MFLTFQKNFIQFGFLIYLVSLLLGLVLNKFKNPRMALSTHVSGLMIGIYSISIAAVSNFIILDDNLENIVFYSHVIGNLLLIISLFLASCWNTKGSTPIMGGEKLSSGFEEKIVSFGLIVSSVLIIISVVIIICGLF